MKDLWKKIVRFNQWKPSNVEWFWFIKEQFQRWFGTKCSFIQDDRSRNRHKKCLFSDESRPVTWPLQENSTWLTPSSPVCPCGPSGGTASCLQPRQPWYHDLSRFHFLLQLRSGLVGFCSARGLQEHWILPGNRLVVHTQLIWNSLKIKKVTGRTERKHAGEVEWRRVFGGRLEGLL